MSKTQELLSDLERSIADFDKVVQMGKTVPFALWQTAFFQRLRFQLTMAVLKCHGYGNEADFITAIDDEAARDELMQFFESPAAGVMLSLDALSEALWAINCDLRFTATDG